MKFEMYLNHKNRKERVAMTKLRCSDHKLKIEEGRWCNIARTERKCPMCPDKVEDEIHFMTDCRLYGLQDSYWQDIYDKVPTISAHSNTDRFIYIMTQEDPILMKIVMKTTYNWLSFRNFMRENFYHQT